MSFPFLLPQTGCECFDRSVHELDACRRRRARLTARENIVLDRCIERRPGYIFLLKVDRHIVCFPAPQNGVDRFIEHTHAVGALRMRTVKPVNRAVAASNKAVGTHGDVDNDFSLAWHRDCGPILVRDVSDFNR